MRSNQDRELLSPLEEETLWSELKLQISKILSIIRKVNKKIACRGNAANLTNSLMSTTGHPEASCLISKFHLLYRSLKQQSYVDPSVYLTLRARELLL